MEGTESERAGRGEGRRRERWMEDMLKRKGRGGEGRRSKLEEGRRGGGGVETIEVEETLSFTLNPHPPTLYNPYNS